MRCGCETSGGWLGLMEIEEEGREGESDAKHTTTLADKKASIGVCSKRRLDEILNLG